MIYKKLLLLLIFILDLNAVDRDEHGTAYKILENKLACAVSEKDAILQVDMILEEILGIDSTHLYSKNVYIRHKRNSNGEYCVEGVVTQAGFDLYIAELDEEYETIMGDIEDLNDGVSYAQKQAEVARLYDDVTRYNQKIDAAEKIAPLSIERIVETKISLSKMINASPIVEFKVDGCKGKYMTGCRLVFISSFQDDSSQVTYRWDFGDGSHSKRTNPIHYYKQPGRYKVSLRITDGGEKYAEMSQELRVAAKPKPKIKYKPNASFSTRKKVYVSGESIDFIDLSSSEKSKITDYKWDFGDGGNSKLSNPKYQYTKTGMYKVHLEIVNSDGLKNDVVEHVQVVHPAITFAIDGRKFNRIVRKFGEPKESIAKKGVLTQAYKYGSDWLLVKQNKVECRIKGSAFKTNLMGNPKNCHWYEKNVRSAIYQFE